MMARAKFNCFINVYMIPGCVGTKLNNTSTLTNKDKCQFANDPTGPVICINRITVDEPLFSSFQWVKNHFATPKN